MMTALLDFAVLCLLTIGIIMVAAAAALPPPRPDPPRIEAEERGNRASSIMADARAR
jgi:hypothetical protein